MLVIGFNDCDNASCSAGCVVGVWAVVESRSGDRRGRVSVSVHVGQAA
jgi:hypothetical protein